MGRHLGAVHAEGRSSRELAEWLRARKQAAGLTVDQIAEASWRLPGGGVSAATVRRALAGDIRPLRAVQDIALACGADGRAAERKWMRARYEQARAADDKARNWAVGIDFVSDMPGLYSALVDLYRRNGARPYREIVERAAELGGRLSTSTVSRVVGSGRAPHGARLSREFTVTFAHACGVPRGKLRPWAEAWDRVERRRDARILRDPGQDLSRLIRAAKAWNNAPVPATAFALERAVLEIHEASARRSAAAVGRHIETHMMRDAG